MPISTLPEISLMLESAPPTLWWNLQTHWEDVTICGVSLAELDVLLREVTLNDFAPTRSIYSNRKRQLSFFAGRLCAAKALRNLGSVECIVGRDVDGVPVWPNGFIGSISHSDTMAVAVASRSNILGGMGLDCEDVATGERLTAILELCCTDADKALVQADLCPTLATLIFSAKEAAYKAISHVFDRVPNFTDFEISRFAPELNRLWLKPTVDNSWNSALTHLPVLFSLYPERVLTFVDLRHGFR